MEERKRPYYDLSLIVRAPEPEPKKWGTKKKPPCPPETLPCGHTAYLEIVDGKWVCRVCGKCPYD